MIDNPILKIIQTIPSTLGGIDFHLVIYNNSNKNIPLNLTDQEIAEEIYETGEFGGYYVIHSSSTSGEDIKKIENGKFFCFNRINCDSILSYHCVAIKLCKTSIKLRTGFHETDLTSEISNSVFDWDSMNNISNGFQEIEINREEFFNLYNKQFKKWRKDITPYIITN